MVVPPSLHPTAIALAHCKPFDLPCTRSPFSEHPAYQEKHAQLVCMSISAIDLLLHVTVLADAWL